jgi:hypothetical protein
MDRCRGIALAVLLLPLDLPAQGTGRAVPDIVTSATVDPNREINFSTGIWPGRVYAGQQATYQIGIFLSESMRNRLRSNPQFVPPDVRSVIAYDLPLPGRLFSRAEGGRTWDVHVYSRALFPVSPGTIDIAPAKLTWMVPLSNSIFSREEGHSATSGTHRLEVRQPPLSGRPDGYAGAVGQLAVSARADGSRKRVGDPFVLTVTVSGIGNVGLFPRPAMQAPWGHVVAGPERVRVDSTSALIRGDKSFEWVITPRESGRQELAAVRYPFFNPYTEQYEVAVTTPVSISVGSGTLVDAAEDEGGGAPRYDVRRTFRGDVGNGLPATPWYWLGVVLIPLPPLVLGWRRRPVRAVEAGPVRRLTRWASVEVPDPVEVRRAVRDAMVERIPAVAGALPDLRLLERVLRRSGVTASTARDLRAVLEELDAILYSGTVARQGDVAQRALALVHRLHEEAVPVTVRGRRVVALLLALGAGAGVAGALAADDDAAAFRAAVQAWDAGDLQEARATFGAIARRRPRAPDAWMNAGTTAWVQGDTAQAVVGWQRSLRLEPLADDARARLGSTPSFRDGLLGDVPPLPVDAVALVAVALWMVAWWRRGRPNGMWMVGAITLGGLAVVAAERQAGRRQVVLGAAEVLRDLPAVSGGAGAQVSAGETARLLATQGNWARVRLPDDREGWIDGGLIVSVEVPRARRTLVTD